MACTVYMLWCDMVGLQPWSMAILFGRRIRVFERFMSFSRCSVHGARGGQELCYLCHQRAEKNVPVYMHEERRRKELEQDRLLQQYQHQKDSEAILNEQVLKVYCSTTMPTIVFFHFCCVNFFLFFLFFFYIRARILIVVNIIRR